MGRGLLEVGSFKGHLHVCYNTIQQCLHWVATLKNPNALNSYTLHTKDPLMKWAVL